MLPLLGRQFVVSGAIGVVLENDEATGILERPIGRNEEPKPLDVLVLWGADGFALIEWGDFAFSRGFHQRTDLAVLVPVFGAKHEDLSEWTRKGIDVREPLGSNSDEKESLGVPNFHDASGQLVGVRLHANERGLGESYAICALSQVKNC